MKTITVKGLEYEIGELYMSVGRNFEVVGYLSHYADSVDNGVFVIQCGGVKYHTCSINQIGRVGRVTIAEITPIPGEYYKFEYYDTDDCLIGYYSEDKDVFVVAGVCYHVEYCTNFILMKEA